MAKVRLRLAEQDWKRFDRGDEWFTVDGQLAELDDMTWDELDAIERDTDVSVYRLVEIERRAVTVRYLRVLAWLARRFAGIAEPYDGFKPNVRRLEMRIGEDEPKASDVDPPADTPSPSSTVSQSG